jgi:hypothetical protein
VKIQPQWVVTPGKQTNKHISTMLCTINLKAAVLPGLISGRALVKKKKKKKKKKNCLQC